MVTGKKQTLLKIRDANGKVNISSAMLLLLYTAASASYIPCALFAGTHITSSYFFWLFSIALALSGVFLCSRIVGSFKPIAPFCLLSVFVLFATPSLTVALIFPILFSSASVFAYLTRELRSPLPLLIFALSYGAVYFVTRSFFLSASIFIVAILAYSLFFSFKKGDHRVGAVCRISSALGVFALAYFLIWIYLKCGNIGIGTLKEFFVALREGITVKLADAFVLAYSQVFEEGIGISYATEISNAVVSSVFNLFPAVFVIILFITSYIAHSLYISLMAATEKDSDSVKNAMFFKMSATSAVLFILTFFATIILSSDGYGLYATVAQNLCVMLQPGLILIAFVFFSSITRGKNASCFSYLIYMAVIAMVFYIPSIILTIASFTGAVLVIASYFRQRKNPSGEDPDINK